MSPTYPGKVHGRYANQTSTLCGMASSAALAILVLPQSANPGAISCQSCRNAIGRQAIK